MFWRGLLVLLVCAVVAAAVDIKIKEVTNQTIKVEWNSPSSGKLYHAMLQSKIPQNGSQSKEIRADKEKKCSLEFTDLSPLTKYTLSIAPGEENGTIHEFVTRPSLEMPNIEEAQTRCAHLTLTPLPENEGKNVERYLLLVRPLEDATDYPADGITDLDLKAQLDSLVQAPYYLAYEFTQEELTEEENGAPVMVGSGCKTKTGKYGSLQDPKLTSGAFYRVVFVAIMNLEGKRTVFAEESSRMLIP